MTLVDRFLIEQDPQAESVGRAALPLSPAPDSAHDKECREPRRERVDSPSGLEWRGGEGKGPRVDAALLNRPRVGSGAPYDSAQEDLRRAYAETVDPMFDRYDEGDWL